MEKNYVSLKDFAEPGPFSQYSVKAAIAKKHEPFNKCAKKINGKIFIDLKRFQEWAAKNPHKFLALVYSAWARGNSRTGTIHDFEIVALRPFAEACGFGATYLKKVAKQNKKTFGSFIFNFRNGVFIYQNKAKQWLKENGYLKEKVKKNKKTKPSSPKKEVVALGDCCPDTNVGPKVCVGRPTPFDLHLTMRESINLIKMGIELLENICEYREDRNDFLQFD